MVIPLISIGNSKGIRLPKALLDQLGIKGHLDLEIKERTIVLKPTREKPRENWEEAFTRMREEGEDRLLLPNDDEAFDWTW